MLVGEVYLLDLERVVAYDNSGEELHLAHNFTFLHLPWDAAAFRRSIDDFEALASEHAWPAWFLANHDHPRVASRFDEAGLGPARARAVLLMLYALRGTPFLYFVAFGTFDRSKPLSGSKYRSAGPGDWLTLTHQTQAKNALLGKIGIVVEPRKLEPLELHLSVVDEAAGGRPLTLELEDSG